MVQTKQNTQSKTRFKKKKKNIWEIEKSHKMVGLNLAIFIMTLNVNSKNEAHREKRDFLKIFWLFYSFSGGLDIFLGISSSLDENIEVMNIITSVYTLLTLYQTPPQCNTGNTSFLLNKDCLPLYPPWTSDNDQVILNQWLGTIKPKIISSNHFPQPQWKKK